jgi:enolase-phosphatase E1
VTVELLDVEGTIGPVTFVRDVLFPLARARLGDFLRRAHAEDEAAWVADAALEAGVAADDAAGLERALRAWMDADRKLGPLKAIQGRIWRDAYAAGELAAPLYADAVAALRAWRSAGRRVAIYSSGSEEAVRLYLRHSDAGNLEDHVEACFDTRVGPKVDPASYVRVAERLGVAPSGIRFWTDSPGEVAAASEAGLGTRWVVRGPVPAGAGPRVDRIDADPDAPGT